jgi:signal transduction histidine kinase
MTAVSSLRRRWPLLVLLASIGLTAFAAWDAQRTARGQTAVVDRAIREFSSFAAWSYSEHLKQQLALAASEVLGAVNHGGEMHTNPNVPEADDLVHYLPDDRSCDCHRTRLSPNPATFFAFKLGTKTVDVARNYYAYPHEGWRVEPVSGAPLPESNLYTEAERQWISDTLNVHARTISRDTYGYGLIVGRFDGRVRPIGYTLMPTAWGDTMVYGVEYSPGAFNEMLAKVLDGEGLLPQTFTQGTRNRDVVAVRVFAGGDDPIYQSMPGVRSPAATTTAMPAAYGSLRVNAMVRPDQASSLIIRGLTPSRLPFILALLIIAAALTFVAFTQIRRETEIAQTRADFVASISHELRTPLAQIKLYVETLRMGRAETPEKRDWSLAHIDRETTRLGNLVENVLRFSRLGRAEEPARESIDAAAEIGRIVDEFAPLASSRKATVALRILQSPLVPIRPEALRHILVNLLDNAVRYGPQGQTITVTLSANGDRAIIAVADQGKGVPRADRETIWRAFTRSKTGTDAGGSGIGLTIVRDLVVRNGGTVGVDDAHDGGAVFTVSLPSAGLAETIQPPISVRDAAGVS